MTIKEAIKKAIDGGYFPFDEGKIEWDEKTKSWWHIWSSEDEDGNPCELKNPICWEHPLYFKGLVLDPLFWQSLGRAMGWTKDICKFCGGSEIESGQEPSSPDNPGDYYENCKKCGSDWMSVAEFEELGNAIPSWLYQWHKFIDHLAEGKTADSFFQSL